MPRAAAMTFTSQFQQWYPQYGWIFDTILHENCTEQYDAYLTGSPSTHAIDWMGGGGTISVLTQPVVLCLLENTSQYLQSVMASAQVVLGLTPTMLAFVGASTEELSMLSIVARRPFLSLLLALGSPSVYISRAFEYRDPLELLKSRPGRLEQRRPQSRNKWLICLLEYTMALLAVVNIALLNWNLGLMTVCTWMSDTVVAPMIWSILVVPIHLAGGVSLRLRFRRVSSKDDVRKIGPKEWIRGLPARLKDMCEKELVPSAAQGPLFVAAFPENEFFIVLSWMLTAGIVCHIIFGTLQLSSLLFIGPKDALGVVGRYMGSVLACRIIVMYEIAGLREQFKYGGQIDVMHDKKKAPSVV
jgi:hypothetical protein